MPRSVRLSVCLSLCPSLCLSQHVGCVAQGDNLLTVDARSALSLSPGASPQIFRPRTDPGLLSGGPSRYAVVAWLAGGVGTVFLEVWKRQ